MNKDIVHQPSDIGMCPFDKLTADKFGKNWSLIRGGYGVPDGSWAITWTSEDLHIEAWILPDLFTRIFEVLTKNAVNERLRQLRSLLEYD